MLDKTSLKIMKILHRHPFIEDDKLRGYFTEPEQSAVFVNAFDHLGTKGYILRGKSDNGSFVYSLTAMGQGAYAEQRRSTIELRLTQIVAVIGALTGIAGVIIGAIALQQ